MEAQQGPPEIVQPLDEPLPVLDACFTDHPVWLVREEDPSVLFQGTIHVVRERDPQQAFMIDGGIKPRPLNPDVPGWGDIHFGKVLKRLPRGAYQMPSPERNERVAIKCINKQVVERERSAGNMKDPYREIYRMQTIGDNVHVLGCIEALQDETNIYIVMPYCAHDSLRKSIPEGVGLPEDEARRYFQQILENLTYLRDHRICHRDLSPDNCMVYRGRVVFSNLDRSILLPPEASHVYGTADPRGNFAYQPPEVFIGLPYNAYGSDLWAAVVTLFYMLTGQMLYYRPEPNDVHYRYFILARGLSRTPWNELTEAVEEDLVESELVSSFDGAHQHQFLPIISRLLQLSPEVVEIYEHALILAPMQRWDLDAVAASAFITQPRFKPETKCNRLGLVQGFI